MAREKKFEGVSKDTNTRINKMLTKGGVVEVKKISPILTIITNKLLKKLADKYILQQELIGMAGFTAKLSARKVKVDNDGNVIKEIEDYGVISTRKVTQAFVAYVIDSMQDSTTYPMDAFKYHDSGTGTNVESNADTALQTPTGVARIVGTQVEGASANIFKTVGTIVYDGNYAITEHGLFSASSAGTLADRSVFSVLNVANLEGIEFTYELTANYEA